MTATTLDEVIDQLTEIVDTARQDGTRVGYFAALYRAVTVQVKEAIAAGRFDDGVRMAALDVAFANRYLTAYEQYRQGVSSAGAWKVTFDSGQSTNLLVLQHLLLGMNAHINFDLGIVAAEIAQGDALPTLEHDFMVINQILADMVNDVQDRIAAFSPWLGWLDIVGGRTDETVVNFSMAKARDSAWDFAQKLAPMTTEARAETIARRDRAVADFAGIITRPGMTLGAIILLVWLREQRDVAQIIEILSYDSI